MSGYGDQIISHMLSANGIEHVLAQSLFTNSVIAAQKSTPTEYQAVIDALSQQKHAAEDKLIEEQSKSQPKAAVVKIYEDRIKDLSDRIEEIKGDKKTVMDRLGSLDAPKRTFSL